jgi:hypothetical protein
VGLVGYLRGPARQAFSRGDQELRRVSRLSRMSCSLPPPRENNTPRPSTGTVVVPGRSACQSEPGGRANEPLARLCGQAMTTGPAAARPKRS